MALTPNPTAPNPSDINPIEYTMFKSSGLYISLVRYPDSPLSIAVKPPLIKSPTFSSPISPIVPATHPENPL